MKFLEFLLAVAALAGLIGLGALAWWNCPRWHRWRIRDWETGLAYRSGKFWRQLEPGHYILRSPTYSCFVFDLRPALHVVPGQDVLTKDNLGLRISVAVRYRTADAQLLLKSVRDDTGGNAGRDAAAHILVQLAIRAAVAARSLAEALEDRAGLEAAMRAGAEAALKGMGVALEQLALRDITLAGPLRSAYAGLASAKLDAEAQLERARAETAALRALANAARLMRDNPDIFKLRALQAIERTPKGAPSIVLDFSAKAEGVEPPGAGEAAAANA
jgi:regulator of protease activity HflC (stomatin/prohibitin superfamily)